VLYPAISLANPLDSASANLTGVEGCELGGFRCNRITYISRQRAQGNVKQVDFEGVIAKKPKLKHLVLHQVLEPAM
jgi:hypothetical protein